MNKNWLTLPLACAALSACVTINIYFPAAAAGKAADKIIDEIMQQKQGAAKPEAQQPAAPATTNKEEAK